MEKNKSYVIWNNKGGVGKSTISFHISTVYAKNNPQRDVVVIDMCPQANSSAMLLGGGKNGEERINKFINLKPPKTVVGYITASMTSMGDPIDPKDYLTKLQKENKFLPENMYLLSGDGNLELVSPLISERANARPISPSDKPWKKVHSIIKHLTEKEINPGRATTFFIDTNPAFSVYTEMAILAGEKLLVPINADDSSVFAIKGLFNLIWGNGSEENIYSKYTFSSLVKEFNMKRPSIHLLIGNRFTQKKGAAHAFKSVSNEATKTMFEEYQKECKDPLEKRFRETKNKIIEKSDFEKEYTVELRDFNSAGVVAANQGIPLDSMEGNVYKVYDEYVQVAKEQRDACKKTIIDLVERL